MMRDEDKLFLLETSKVLSVAQRFGADGDSPEGTCWVQMSDTLANELAKRLDEIANCPCDHSQGLRQWVTIDEFKAVLICACCGEALGPKSPYAPQFGVFRLLDVGITE